MTSQVPTSWKAVPPFFLVEVGSVSCRSIFVSLSQQRDSTAWQRSPGREPWHFRVANLKTAKPIRMSAWEPKKLGSSLLIRLVSDGFLQADRQLEADGGE